VVRAGGQEGTGGRNRNLAHISSLSPSHCGTIQPDDNCPPQEAEHAWGAEPALDLGWGPGPEGRGCSCHSEHGLVLGALWGQESGNTVAVFMCDSSVKRA
jgi:hypothetical protein